MNHKRWIVVISILFFAFVFSAFVSEYSGDTAKTEMEVLQKHNFDVDQDKVQFVRVPNSNYTLAIMHEPVRVAVLNKKEGFFRRDGYEFETVFNLYEHANGDIGSSSSFVEDSKLKYGFIKMKDAQDVTLDGKKIPSIPIGSYFEGKKFAWTYKDLAFWYLEKPVTDTNQTVVAQ